MKKLSLLLMLTVSVASMAQERIASYVVRSVSVNNPVMTDTVNAMGEKFKGADILKTPIELTFKKGDAETVMTGEDGSVKLNKPTHNSNLHLLGFRAYAKYYTKAKFKITSANMLEVYVDGKKVDSKLTLEDSISATSVLTVGHTFEPMRVYDLCIKVLSQEGDRIEPSIVCEVEKDSDVDIYTSTDTKRYYALSNNFIGKRVANVSISPNGKYVLTNYSMRYNTKKIEFYGVLTETRSGKVVIPRLNGIYKWMPKSSKLYYTATSANGVDVLTLDPSTMEEDVVMSDVANGNIIWSPAEDYVVLMVNEEARKNVGPMKYHASQYDKVNGRGRTLLTKYHIATGVSERLTFGNRSSSLNDISASGKRLMFMTSTTDYSHREAVKMSLYEVDMESFKVDTILKDQWYMNQAAYSPEADEILLLAGPDAFGGVGKNCGNHPIPNNYDVQAFIMNRESGDIRSISKDFNPSISAVLTWNAATNTIYFKAEDGMYEQVFAYDVSSNKWNKLNVEENIIRSFSIDEKGQMAVYSGLSMRNSVRAYSYSVKKGKSEMYADPMNEVYADIEFGAEEDFVFTTTDGSEIDGYVCFPPQYDATKKYPMIVYYYGGTSPSQKWSEFYYGAHLFASRGYIVYVVNPSGTTGYGQEFAARHVNAWGLVTADEIIEGTKLVCEKYPSVNKEAIGCIGASYGGFMTQYLLTKTDIFAGAVSHAGISNLASYWGEGYWGLGYNYVAAADSYPWNSGRFFNEQGSLFNADKITTPLLLMHGSVDTNVPIGESVQLYNALKRLGKTVEFVEVEGENHTIVGSLDKQILWHNTIMAWFAKTLQGQGAWWDALYPKVWTE